jgi:hypothetical protein
MIWCPGNIEENAGYECPECDEFVLVETGETFGDFDPPGPSDADSGL